MPFHRLTVPSYFGGLPGGYDYINNAGGGTPAPADGAKGSGVNVGTYFIAFAEDATSAAFNRPANALAENCDYIDDILRRDVAVPTISDFAQDVVPVTSIILTGPGIFIGKTGTPNTPEGINTFLQLTDQDDNEITNGGVECKVTAISDTVGAGFSAGNVTLTVSPGIPAGIDYRVYHAVRGNLATLPVDAFTSIKIRGAEEVPADLLLPGGAALIGFAGSGAWADGTTNPAADVETQLDKIVADLAGAAGSAKIYSPAAAGAPYALTAGRLDVQLAALLANANANAALAAANTALINTNLALLAAIEVPGFRLTGTSGVPVTTGDLFNITTLYYTPQWNNKIGLWDGVKWTIVSSAEVSINLVGLPADTNHDVFAYSNAGVLTLEVLAWSGDLTRATALTLQDGIPVKSGDATRRYIGTIRTSAIGETADTVLKRFVWNYYNRIEKKLRKTETTDSWVYSAGTYRAANGLTSNSVEFVTGAEVSVWFMVHTLAQAASANWGCTVGLGFDSTTVNSADIFGALTNANEYAVCRCDYKGIPAVGYHRVYWLEISGGVAVTFTGDLGFPDFSQHGLFGSVPC